MNVIKSQGGVRLTRQTCGISVDLASTLQPHTRLPKYVTYWSACLLCIPFCAFLVHVLLPIVNLKKPQNTRAKSRTRMSANKSICLQTSLHWFIINTADDCKAIRRNSTVFVHCTDYGAGLWVVSTLTTIKPPLVISVNPLQEFGDPTCTRVQWPKCKIGPRPRPSHSLTWRMNEVDGRQDVMTEADEDLMTHQTKCI